MGIYEDADKVDFGMYVSHMATICAMYDGLDDEKKSAIERVYHECFYEAMENSINPGKGRK